MTLVEPVSFNSGTTDVVTLWAMAKLRLGDYEAALNGFTFLVSPDARASLSASPAFAHATLGS